VTDIAIIRDYESLYIIDPNLTDEQIQAITDKYSQIITQNGGEVLSVERWDKRRLAYEVARKREGIFILMYFRSEAKVASELDRLMRINEDVMRHLIVRDEQGQAAAAVERVAKAASKAAEKQAEAEAATEAEESPAEAETSAEAEEAPAEAEAEAVEEQEAAETAQPEEPAPAVEAEPAKEQPAESTEEAAE